MKRRDTVTLPVRDLSGSKLRCLMLTSLPKRSVATALQSLVSPIAQVHPDKHKWLPMGLLDPGEAKLDECLHFLKPEVRKQLLSWWLIKKKGANTPNWDIVSTCTIQGHEGLLLIEAKAHDAEAREEGKSGGNAENHEQIGKAIAEANSALRALSPGWSIQRDSHYQLSNRFAWSWKIASLGIPVILVYLGFLNADEMAPCGKTFVTDSEWRNWMLRHSASLVPDSGWETRIQTAGAPLWALLRTMDVKWTVGG